MSRHGSMGSIGTSSGGRHPRDWILTRSLAQTWTRFREGWERLPPTSRRTWLLSMGVGLIVAIGATMLTVSLASSAREPLAAWDEALLHRVLEGVPLSFSNALVLQTVGETGLLVVLAGFVAAISAWMGRPLRALSFVATFFPLYAVVAVGWLVWSRARPMLVAGGIAAPGLNAFPSGHTAHAVATYGLLVYFWVRAAASRLEQALALMVVTAAVAAVGVGRLRMGVHWPSDILAGLGIGLLWLGVIVVALRRAEAAGARPQRSSDAR